MILVAVTMRVDMVGKRPERRDTFAKGWQPLLALCGAVGVAIPNEPRAVATLMNRLDPAAIVLSGGNDLACYGGNAPERDATETAMIEWAERRQRPMIGVCRGMEMLAHAFGGTLRQVEGHFGDHAIRHEDGREVVVNSLHRWAVDRVPDDFRTTAQAPDGVVEAIRHNSLSIQGIMWHPERRETVPEDDLTLFRTLFDGAMASA